MAGAPLSSSWVSGTARVLVRHPELWGVAVGQALRMARPRWWRRAPFAPVPDPSYLAFRLETQYGDDAAPDPEDVITYLHWCRAFRRGR